MPQQRDGMQKHTILRDVLAYGADDAVAIAAPSSKPMTFKRLRQQIGETAQALSAFGAGSEDRVAIVLPNGPEMAAAFLSVANHAASAPLNPSYKEEEFEFYLSDLGAKLLIVEAGSTSPAIEVAKRLGVKIVSLTPDPQLGAGQLHSDWGTERATRSARANDSRQHCSCAPHVRNNLAAQDRAAEPAKSLRISLEYQSNIKTDTC